MRKKKDKKTQNASSIIIGKSKPKIYLPMKFNQLYRETQDGKAEFAVSLQYIFGFFQREHSVTVIVPHKLSLVPRQNVDPDMD